MTERIRKPLTPEQVARKAEVNRIWRANNAAHLRRYNRKNAVHIARRRRANYARNDAARANDQARARRWKAAHPDHNREFYRTNIDAFTGDGKWASRARKTRRALKTFAATLAASRRRLAAVPRETNNLGASA